MSREAPIQDRPRQEPRDLRPDIVLWSVGAIVAMLIVAVLLAYLVHQLGGPTRNSPQSLQMARNTRLASDPADERAAFEHAKTTRLNSYGWIDPQHQLAHIPIDVAMQKLAEPRSTAPSQP